VGISAGGEAVAVWEHQEGADYRTQAATRPAGGAWTKAIDISPKGDDANLTDVAVDPAGDAVAVWEMQVTATIESASRPPAGSWSPPQKISSADKAFLPQVAIGPGGQTAATWERENSPGNYTVRGATGSVGAPWSEPADVSTSGNVTPGGVAVEADGTAVAVWRGLEGTAHPIQTARKQLGGAWSKPLTISPLGQEAEAAAIVAAPGGGALAVWSRIEAPKKIIEAAAYDAAGPQLRSLSIPASSVVGQLATFSVSPFDAWSAPGATSWSFGDGGSATGNAVSHAYSGAGTYTVTVTATDALGNARSASGRVEVAAPPFAGRAQTKRVLKVKQGKVLLPLSCAGGTLPCTGAARILASARPGHTAHASARRKPRKATIAAAGFDVAAGQTRIVKLPLSRKGRRWLASAGPKGLKAQLGGTGLVGRAVVLRPAAARHGRKHHEH
jgi:PKD repeat protein